MSKSRNSAKTYVIPSTANGGLVIQYSGTFIFIASATENLNIQVIDSDEEQVGDIENFPTGLGQPFPDGFTKVRVQTASGAAGTCSLIMGSDMATFTALTGTVNIIDQKAPRARALSGISMRSFFSTTSGAGNRGAVILRNPAASGVNLIIYALKSSSTNGSDTMDWGKLLGGGLADLANINPTNNVYGGQPAGKGVLSWANAVPAYATSQSGLGNPIDEDFDSCPEIVAPGQGLYLYAENITFGLQGEVQWDEEAI